MMAATDLVTTSEAAAYLQQPNTTGLLPAWIEAVSARLDDLCGPIVSRTVTDQLDGGMTSVLLSKPPVLSVTSVTEYVATTATVLTLATNSSQPTAGYHLDALAGRVERRSGASRASFPAGEKNVVVVYAAGRYADTASVGWRFKQAALIAVSHLWQVEHGTRNQTFSNPEGTAGFGPGWSIPKRALDILGDELSYKVAIA